MYTQTEVEEAFETCCAGLEAGRTFDRAELDYFADVLRPANLIDDGRRLDDTGIAYADLLTRLQGAGRDLSHDEVAVVERAARQQDEDREWRPQTDLEAHLWDLDHPDEAAAIYAARMEEVRALGIEIEDRATVADDEEPGGLVVRDNCAQCGADIEVHMPPSVCPDCRAAHEMRESRT